MKKENSQERARPEREGCERQEVDADDLRFMRSVIEKTNRVFNPGSPIMIVCGLICLIGYPATQYFLATPQLYELIQPMWIILWVIGAAVGIYNGIIAGIREKKTGFISQISNQIGLVWFILLLNGTIWSAMRLHNIYFGDLAFLWAAIFGFGLSITGILSSKVWLVGGIAILISIVAASIMNEHAYVILGIAMGLSCIIPAVIAQRNYRKQEKENV